MNLVTGRYYAVLYQDGSLRGPYTKRGNMMVALYDSPGKAKRLANRPGSSVVEVSITILGVIPKCT